MEGIISLVSRITVCALLYALTEALFPKRGSRRGLFESAAKAAAIALTAAALNI
jgi:hypothetical protein